MRRDSNPTFGKPHSLTHGVRYAVLFTNKSLCSLGKKAKRHEREGGQSGGLSGSEWPKPKRECGAADDSFIGLWYDKIANHHL